MSDRVRAFFAVELSAVARERALEAQETLRSHAPADVRWVAPEALHLTLKFLGEIRDEDVSRLVDRASAKLAGSPPFEVSIGGFGAFPGAREARVLWLGVGRGSAALAKLARKLDAAARAVGAERERRPFAAHLTLGRLREPHRVEIERAPAPESVAFHVQEVVLFESRPTPRGSTYVPLAHLPLGAGVDPETSEFAPES